MANEIWFIADTHSGQLSAATKELITKAGELAQALGGQVATLVLDPQAGQIAEQVFGYGVTKAYIVEDGALQHYTTDAYVGAAAALIKQYQPRVLLTGASLQMRDFTAAL